MDHHTKTFNFNDDTISQPLRIRMAPLIDIVFLLICFFMMTSHMIRQQEDPSINLPKMVNQQLIPERPSEIVINLNAQGDITVNQSPATLAGLTSFLAEQKRITTFNNQALHVVIRPDRQQSFGRLNELLTTCRTAGINQVSFRAKKDNQP